MAVEVLPWFEKEAKERQQKHGGTAPGKKSLSQKIDTVKARSTEQAATMLNTNRQYVSDAKKLKAEVLEK